MFYGPRNDSFHTQSSRPLIGGSPGLHIGAGGGRSESCRTGATTAESQFDRTYHSEDDSPILQALINQVTGVSVGVGIAVNPNNNSNSNNSNNNSVYPFSASPPAMTPYFSNGDLRDVRREFLREKERDGGAQRRLGPSMVGGSSSSWAGVSGGGVGGTASQVDRDARRRSTNDVRTNDSISSGVGVGINSVSSSNWVNVPTDVNSNPAAVGTSAAFGISKVTGGSVGSPPNSNSMRHSKIDSPSPLPSPLPSPSGVGTRTRPTIPPLHFPSPMYPGRSVDETDSHGGFSYNTSEYEPSITQLSTGSGGIASASSRRWSDGESEPQSLNSASASNSSSSSSSSSSSNNNNNNNNCNYNNYNSSSSGTRGVNMISYADDNESARNRMSTESRGKGSIGKTYVPPFPTTAGTTPALLKVMSSGSLPLSPRCAFDDVSVSSTNSTNSIRSSNSARAKVPVTKSSASSTSRTSSNTPSVATKKKSSK